MKYYLQLGFCTTCGQPREDIYIGEKLQDNSFKLNKEFEDYINLNTLIDDEESIIINENGTVIDKEIIKKYITSKQIC